MKILYFVKGGVPSEEQRGEARAMGALIRNGNISSGDFVERCDAVAGDVPEVYADFPREVPYKLISSPDAGAGAGEVIQAATPAIDSDGDAVAGESKPLADMSNKELDARAAELEIKFPAAVNTRAEKIEFIQTHLDAKEPVTA